MRPKDKELFLAIAGVTLAALLILGSGEAAAQSSSVLGLVEECDILAAHPADPERMSDGVTDDQIVPRLAILACEDASDVEPDDARFKFQLGRALLAVGRDEEALALFQEASDADYSAAWAYLGDAHQFGLGTPVDGQKAYQAYQKALELGFLEAEAQIEQLTFDPSLYTLPFIEFFYNGKYDQIAGVVNEPARSPTTRNYIFNVVQTLLYECEPFLKPDNVPALYGFRYPQGWTQEDDNTIAVAIQTEVAEYDAATFLRRHGCDGLIAHHMFDSMNRYFATNP